MLAVNDVKIDGRRLENVGVSPDIDVPYDIRYSAGADPQFGPRRRRAQPGKLDAHQGSQTQAALLDQCLPLAFASRGVRLRWISGGKWSEKLFLSLLSLAHQSPSATATHPIRARLDAGDER